MYPNKGWDSKSRNPEMDMFPSLKKLLRKRKKNKNRQYKRKIKMIHMQINIIKYFTF